MLASVFSVDIDGGMMFLLSIAIISYIFISI